MNENKIYGELSNKINSASSFDKICVIVTFKENTDQSENTTIKSMAENKEINYKYNSIPAVSATLTIDEINSISNMDTVDHIEYDSLVHIEDTTAKYWFGVSKAARDFGVTGLGNSKNYTYSTDNIVIAVIDTGIDANHIDFRNGKVIGWKDFINGKAEPYDDNGHGTHCSSIAAGYNFYDYRGVAPGAALVGVKVMNSSGSGTTSDIVAGIDWCITNKDKYSIDVMSISLGSNQSSDGKDAKCLAVNAAVKAGITVCCSGGNSGPELYTTGSPAAAADVITVGAMADVGKKGFYLADFSSRGPTRDNRLKPDIVAPGVNILAAKANTKDQYVEMSGTSMSTPFVAGVAALMLDVNNDLSPSVIKSIMIETADSWGDNGMNYDYGSGRLDAYEAIKAAGNLKGRNIVLPQHFFRNGKIDAGKYDEWEIGVSSTKYPVAITLIKDDTQVSSSDKNDLNITISSPFGDKIKVADKEKVNQETRQKLFFFIPKYAGNYILSITSEKSHAYYKFDLSIFGGNLRRIQKNK